MLHNDFFNFFAIERSVHKVSECVLFSSARIKIERLFSLHWAQTGKRMAELDPIYGGTCPFAAALVSAEPRMGY
jgi:hypothetical protein